MKHFLFSIFFLAFSQTGFCVDEPTVNLDLLVDGSVTSGHTVSGFLSKPESFTLQLKEKPVGAAIGVAHIWSDTLKKTAQISKYSVDVKVLVTKTESNDGKISWWAQVTFGNKIVAGLGGAELTGLRLMANGAPQSLEDSKTLEPRAIVDFK